MFITKSKQEAEEYKLELTKQLGSASIKMNIGIIGNSEKNIYIAFLEHERFRAECYIDGLKDFEFTEVYSE